MRTVSRILFLGITLFSLSGCGFHPASGTLSLEQREVVGFERLEIAPPSSLLEQALRNRLLASRAEGGLKKPLYKLELDLVSTEEPSIQALDTSTLRTQYRLSVDFTLVDLKTHQVVYQDRVFSIVSYDHLTLPFANTQAKRSAEKRAVSDVATRIRARILRYFSLQSTHKAPVR